MVSVSNAFKNAFTATTREIHARIGLIGMYNGNTVSKTLYEDDIFDLEVDYPFDADELPVYGHCLSASLKCRIKNPNMSTYFSKGTVYITADVSYLDMGTSPETCALGQFIVTRYSSSDNFKTYDIEAVDYIGAFMNEVYDWRASFFPILTDTVSALSVVQDICSHCNIALAPGFTLPTDYQGNALTIRARQGSYYPYSVMDWKKSSREWLSMIAGAVGANAYIRRDGYLDFKYYDDERTTVIPLSMQYMGGLHVEREDPYYYKGFYNINEEATGWTTYAPSQENGVIYTNIAPGYVTYGDQTMRYYSDQFKASYFTSPNTTDFVPGELEYRGMPWLECGDIVSVKYIDFSGTEQTGAFIISHHALSITGGMHGTMRCYSKSDADIDYTSGSSQSGGGGGGGGISGNTDVVLGADTLFDGTATGGVVSAITSNLVTTSVPNVTAVGSASTWTFTVTGENLTISGGNGSAPTLGTAITVATGSLDAGGTGATVATGASLSTQPTITITPRYNDDVTVYTP